jgi:hypothetical protein
MCPSEVGQQSPASLEQSGCTAQFAPASKVVSSLCLEVPAVPLLRLPVRLEGKFSTPLDAFDTDDSDSSFSVTGDMPPLL